MNKAHANKVKKYAQPVTLAAVLGFALLIVFFNIRTTVVEQRTPGVVPQSTFAEKAITEEEKAELIATTTVPSTPVYNTPTATYPEGYHKRSEFIGIDMSSIPQPKVTISTSSVTITDMPQTGRIVSVNSNLAIHNITVAGYENLNLTYSIEKYSYFNQDLTITFAPTTKSGTTTVLVTVTNVYGEPVQLPISVSWNL